MVGAASAAAALGGSSQGVAAKVPKITARCALDLKIGYDATTPRRVVIGLYGEEAPVLTSTFIKACTGTYPGEAGGSARYQLSTIRSISKDRLISFADFPGGNFLFRRTAPSRGGMVTEQKIPLAGPDTKSEETNELRHDTLGRVSMPKGGGTFNFLISPVASAPFLDKNNVVIGQVVEGLDVIQDLNNFKTIMKGGVINLLNGRGPDDVISAMAPESGDDYLSVPRQKIKVVKSSLMDT